jgi:hypothetical protein
MSRKWETVGSASIQQITGIKKKEKGRKESKKRIDFGIKSSLSADTFRAIKPCLNHHKQTIFEANP